MPLLQVEAVWLAVEPVDMRSGARRLLARVVQVFGVAQAHHGYLFANARAARIELQVHDERLMRPWALRRKNWLFAGSGLAAQPAAVVMSLVQSAKLNGHKPWAYLKDVLTRLPMHLNSRFDELLPHNWSRRLKAA